jgi:mono/diheme cytochrome c family protein
MNQILLRAAIFLTSAILLAAASGSSQAGSLEERGRYLAQIMDCGGCHTRGALLGQPDQALFLAGSEVGFELPGLGVFYPPNLTSDTNSGLGNWSVEDIVAAVTTGMRPDGRELAPIMPWRSYAALTPDDARALAAYIKTLPAVSYRAPGPFGPGEAVAQPYLSVKAAQ